MHVVILVLLASMLGCRDNNEREPPPPSGELQRAIAECNQAVAAMTSTTATSPIHERAKALACASLYSKPECGEGLRVALNSGGGLEAFVAATNNCADVYCDDLDKKPRLCRKRFTFVQDGEREPTDAAEQITELDTTILKTELPREDAERLGRRFAAMFFRGVEVPLPK